MNTVYTLRVFMVGAALVGVAFGCKPKSTEAEDPFDRSTMLTRYADSLIIPAYTNYHVKTDTLNARAQRFKTVHNEAAFTSLREAYQAASSAWQSVEGFAFGPGEENRIQLNSNYLPVDTADIRALALAGNTASVTTAVDNRGFPALDYMLYAYPGNTAASMARYNDPTHGEHWRNLLASQTQQVHDLATATLSGWTGSFRQQWIEQNGTDAGSSLSFLVNGISMHLDIIKRYKVGNPSGYDGNVPTGTRAAQVSEAYYSGMSKEKMLLALDALEKTYMNGSGLGIDDYLIAIDAQYNGQSLHQAIDAQFELVRTKMNQISPDWVSVVNSATSNTTADEVFFELKKLLVLIKVDMPSNLGVAITYSDNDGD